MIFALWNETLFYICIRFNNYNHRKTNKMSEAKKILVRVWDRLENDIKNFDSISNEYGTILNETIELNSMRLAEQDVMELFNTTK